MLKAILYYICLLYTSGTPITGRGVDAAITPGRAAAIPAAAMITFTPQMCIRDRKQYIKFTLYTILTDNDVTDIHITTHIGATTAPVSYTHLGVKVIIAAAGMAAAFPGVIAASTPLPVIGVPIKGMLDGLDAMLSIIQMPPGIPVALSLIHIWWMSSDGATTVRR